MPSVVVLDVTSANKDLLFIVRRISLTCLAALITVRAATSDDQWVAQVLCAGAANYVAKSDPLKTLVDNVRAAYRGQLEMPRSLAQRLLWNHARPASTIERNREMQIYLTVRERAILTEIARGKSLAEVSIALGLSEQILASYNANIIRKLHNHRLFEVAMSEHETAPRWKPKLIK